MRWEKDRKWDRKNKERKTTKGKRQTDKNDRWTLKLQL